MVKRIVFLAIAIISIFGTSTIRAKKYSKQIFATVAYQDWIITSTRQPPHQETVDVDVEGEEAGGSSRTIRFRAMGRTWLVKAHTNTVLFANDFAVDERDTATGAVRRRDAGTRYRHCFFVGTADAGANEHGLAAVTSCQGTFRVYIITNVNDYMINPKIPTGSASHNTFYEAHQFARLKRSALNQTYNNMRSAVKIVPQPPMNEGRALFVEKTLIFDKTYADEFTRRMGNRDEMDLYGIELMNMGQLWFLHHTLGMQVWFTLKKVIYLSSTMRWTDNTYKFQSICKWQNRVFKDSGTWDQVALITSDPNHCNGIGGVASPSGTCNGNNPDPTRVPQCYCVTDHKFQPSTFVRTLVHESAHTIGMPDDYAKPQSNICFTGMMRYAAYEDRDWSTCSIQSMENFLYVRSNTCIQKRQTPSLSAGFQPPLVPLNVAWRAKATQSSTYETDERWGAWKATDGPVAGPHYDNPEPKWASCTHTQKERNPWIRIELGADARRNYIDSIDVFNREDCCAGRLANFEVRVGDSSRVQANPVCTRHRGAVPGGKYGMVRVRCDRPIRGRYVSVQLLTAAPQILSVCEIAVNQQVRAKPFSPIGACFDEARFCFDWVGRGECERSSPRRGNSETECRYACGFCTKVADMPKLEPGLKSRAYPPTTSPACVTTDKHCGHLSANGRCRRHRTQCPRHCDTACGASVNTGQEKEEGKGEEEGKKEKQKEEGSEDRDGCRDTDPGCPAWRKYCDNSGHVKANCRRTCGRCWY